MEKEKRPDTDFSQLRPGYEVMYDSIICKGLILSRPYIYVLETTQWTDSSLPASR